MSKPDSPSTNGKRIRDGTPEPFAKGFGEEVAKLRSMRGLSRSKLSGRLERLLPENGTYKSYGESFIKRIESGKTVKITRELLEALCQAMGCTQQEKIRLILLADRNILRNDNKVPAQADELFLLCMEDMYKQVSTLLDIPNSTRGNQLTVRDMRTLICNAVQLIWESDGDEL